MNLNEFEIAEKLYVIRLENGQIKSIIHSL